MDLHAHISTVAVDCDGPFHRSYVETFNDDEIEEHARALNHGMDLGYDGPVNDFSEIHFMNRVLSNVASPYACHHGMRVTIDDEGIEVHENTDEGYREATVRWCRDECDTDAHSQRDVYAEMMNY